jgi:two-component system cell cycle response regulator
MSQQPDKTHNLRQLRDLADDTAVVPPLRPVATAPEACLVYIYPSGPLIGRRYRVGTDPVLLGREDHCSITLADGSVSREHARLGLGPDGQYQVEDLVSTNGTFVNNARVRVGPLRDGDYLRVGNCIFRFLAGGNIEAEYHEEIHRLTILDPLTGLHNRRSLNEFLDREVERARRHRRPLSVALFDIDHFKVINDRLGHLGGDFTLKNLTMRLKELTRRDELLARYGGEEFALVLPETDLDRAILCGERIRKAVAERPFEFEGRSYPVTISVGLASVSGGDPGSAADLLRRADRWLYEAKRAGRNRVAPAARPAADTPPPAGERTPHPGRADA